MNFSALRAALLYPYLAFDPASTVVSPIQDYLFIDARLHP
jgi:hypothetical protein